MAMTISIGPPAGSEVIPSVLIILALLWVIQKCLVLGKAEPSDPVCIYFTDCLPSLGDRPFNATELAHRGSQEAMKKQIDTLEKNRQAAFAEICKVHARRVKIEKTIENLKGSLKAEFPHDIEPAIGIKKRIRHLTKEQEECYGMVDDICHRMYMMLIQRLALRRKIDRLDLQMESARLADIMYPYLIPAEALGDKDRELKKD